MIKKFKNKMLIALFLLVIGLTVTSSCYASNNHTIDDFEFSFDQENNTYTIHFFPEEVAVTKTIPDNKNISDYSNYYVIIDLDNNTDEEGYFGYDFVVVFCDNYSWGYESNSVLNYKRYYLTFDNGFALFGDFHKYKRGDGVDAFSIGYDYGEYAFTSSTSMNSRNAVYVIDAISGDLISSSSETKILSSSFDEILNPVTNKSIIVRDKKIVYEVTYDEDNTKAKINASIKNSTEGDKLYYSTLGYKLDGKLLSPIEIAQDSISFIPVSKNGLIHLQALDSERQYYRYSWY